MRSFWQIGSKNDYEFGNVELIEVLSDEQGNDYTKVVKDLFDMRDEEDD